MGRHLFSHPQQSRAASTTAVTWENKHHHSKRPTLPLSSPALHTEHNGTWFGKSLWSLCVARPGCLLPALMCCQPPHHLGSTKAQGALAVWALLSKNENIPVTNPASSTILKHSPLWRKLTLLQSYFLISSNPANFQISRDLTSEQNTLFTWSRWQNGLPHQTLESCGPGRYCMLQVQRGHSKTL